MAIRLGDLLVQRGVLTEQQKQTILAEQVQRNRPFGALAEQLFGVNPRDIEEAWADQYEPLARHIDPRREPVEREAIGLIDRRQAWQFGMLPIRFDGPELLVCTTRRHLVRALKFAGWRINALCFFALSDPRALGEALVQHYPMSGMTPDTLERGCLAA